MGTVTKNKLLAAWMPPQGNSNVILWQTTLSWKVMFSFFFQSLKQVDLKLLFCACLVKSLTVAASVHSAFKTCCRFAPQMIIGSPIPWKNAALTYFEDSYQHRNNHGLITVLFEKENVFTLITFLTSWRPDLVPTGVCGRTPIIFNGNKPSHLVCIICRM